MSKQTGIQVKLIGQDGNAFAIVGAVARAMTKAGVDPTIIDAYKVEAFEGDYNHLLSVTMDYVEVV